METELLIIEMQARHLRGDVAVGVGAVCAVVRQCRAVPTLTERMVDVRK